MRKHPLCLLRGALTPRRRNGPTILSAGLRQPLQLSSYASSIMGDSSHGRRHIKDLTDLLCLVIKRSPCRRCPSSARRVDRRSTPQTSKLISSMCAAEDPRCPRRHPDLKRNGPVYYLRRGGGYYDRRFIPTSRRLVTVRASRWWSSHPYSTGRACGAQFIPTRLDPQIHRAHLAPQSAHRSPRPIICPNPQRPQRHSLCSVNAPAIGDLFEMFDFDAQDDQSKENRIQPCESPLGQSYRFGSV